MGSSELPTSLAWGRPPGRAAAQGPGAIAPPVSRPLTTCALAGVLSSCRRPSSACSRLLGPGLRQPQPLSGSPAKLPKGGTNEESPCPHACEQKPGHPTGSAVVPPALPVSSVSSPHMLVPSQGFPLSQHHLQTHR